MAVLLVLLCSATGTSAPAEEKVYVPYSGIVKGTQGTSALALSLENGTGGRLACTAQLAHWYSESLGEVAPGGVLDIALRHDPETGQVSLMNATNDRMPVEALWCGTAGALTDTRTRIELPIAAGPAPADLRRACRANAGARIVCVESEG